MSFIFIITIAIILFLVLFLTYNSNKKNECNGKGFCDTNTTWNGKKCVANSIEGDKYCDEQTTTWNGSKCIGITEDGDKYCDPNTTKWNGEKCVALEQSKNVLCNDCLFFTIKGNELWDGNYIFDTKNKKLIKINDSDLYLDFSFSGILDLVEYVPQKKLYNVYEADKTTLKFTIQSLCEECMGPNVLENLVNN